MVEKDRFLDQSILVKRGAFEPLNISSQRRSELVDLGRVNMLKTDEFFLWLLQSVCEAESEILLRSFVYEPSGDITGAIHKELLGALDREVPVTLSVDQFILAWSDGPVKWSLNPTERRRRHDMIEHNVQCMRELEESGAQVIWSHEMSEVAKWFPFFGRDHRKYGKIDDWAWIGGLNLADDVFEREDVMFVTSDDNLVEAIKRVHEQDVLGNVVRDWPVKVLNSDKSVLLFDVGKPSESLITDSVTDWVLQAQERVVMVNPHAPEGKLWKAMKKVRQRGVPVEYVTSDPDVGVPFFDKLSFQSASDWDYFVSKRELDGVSVHAKVMLIDNLLVVSTCNFTKKSVMLGTKELALVTQDRQAVKEAQRWLEQLPYGDAGVYFVE